MIFKESFLDEFGYKYLQDQFSSIQFTQSCPTLCNFMDCSMPGFPVHHQLPELTQTHVHWVSDAIQHLIFGHPLLLPSIFPSNRVFSNESVHVAKVLEFQVQHQFFQWIFRTDFLRIDWFDLLAVQRTLKSLLQHHSSKASILWCCFLYSPILTSIHDYWKNHNFD